jgi:hypothetical protein
MNVLSGPVITVRSLADVSSVYVTGDGRSEWTCNHSEGSCRAFPLCGSSYGRPCCLFSPHVSRRLGTFCHLRDSGLQEARSQRLGLVQELAPESPPSMSRPSKVADEKMDADLISTVWKQGVR